MPRVRVGDVTAPVTVDLGVFLAELPDVVARLDTAATADYVTLRFELDGELVCEWTAYLPDGVPASALRDRMVAALQAPEPTGATP